MKLLIVEDEEELYKMTRDYLGREGYICELATNFEEAEDKIMHFEYDVLLLDIGLPKGNGLDLIPILKKHFPKTGILIISAKQSLDDKVKGLDMGADDYLAKPFHLAELNARLKALLRRRNFDGSDILEFQELALDLQSNVLKVHDRPVELTKKEYDLLLFFISNKNRVLTKAAIAEHLWGDYMDLADNFDLVYSHIKNLRKKILREGGEDYIKTVYAMGYKFTAT